MRDAAVGFQCPDCVKEGARATRQGKGAYGGARTGAPGQTSIVLIGINLAVFVAVYATGGYGGQLADVLGLLPQSAQRGFGGPVVQGVSGGAWWQLVTVMFTHAAVWHVAANMFSLYFLGPAVEQVLGRARFLAVYLGSGLVASATIMWLSNPNQQTVGASGAIFGLLGAFLVLAVKIRADLRQILGWLGLNLVITFLVPGISWQGHVGGLVGGALLAAIVVYAPKKNREPVQWAGIGLVVVLAVGAAVVRGLALA